MNQPNYSITIGFEVPDQLQAVIDSIDFFINMPVPSPTDPIYLRYRDQQVKLRQVLSSGHQVIYDQHQDMLKQRGSSPSLQGVDNISFGSGGSISSNLK